MSAHFKPAALRFLRSLARNNDRDWFNARKPTYESELKEPMLALIDQLNHAMLDFAPDYVRPPHKIMMRIYRDTRFSPDKRPYKRQISAWWARHGMEKTSGGGFYIHIHPSEVLVSCGVYMPERDQLLAIRRHLADHHEDFRRLHTALLRKRSLGFTSIDAQALTRIPKGFAADHPAADLLRARNWGIHASLPPSLAEEPRLTREILARFRAAAPLVDFLNQPLLAPATRANIGL